MNPNPLTQGTSQQATTAAAKIGQTPVYKQVEFAITGDGIADLMAGIRQVCDESGLSARQVQFIFECYAKLYKDAADNHDKDQADRRLSQHIGQVTPDWVKTDPGYHYTTTSGTSQLDAEAEALARRIRALDAMVKQKSRQSGTHSPSTHLPDSAGSSLLGAVPWASD